MSRTRSNEFDVVIVGGGVLGLVMGCLLLARKLCTSGRVAVVADQPTAMPPLGADWDLRVFAMSRASEQLLKICGIWNSLPQARVFPYERMCVWDAAGKPQGLGSLTFDCAQIGEPNLGHIIEGRALQWQCLQSARAAGVVLIEGTAASIAAGDESVTLHLKDGRELRSELLVGADGTESKSRQLLGISTAGHAYHQDALVGHVQTSKPHDATAWPASWTATYLGIDLAIVFSVQLRVLQPRSAGGFVVCLKERVERSSTAKQKVTAHLRVYRLVVTYSFEWARF